MPRSSAVVNHTTYRLLGRHRSALVGADALPAPEPRHRRRPIVPMRREDAEKSLVDVA
ncbi:hypothetical protein BN12_910010 [Nostocoides japonicum T1-X7]|uniref:Uncharacterized protein n=1 Tax=Nostocoides japonicum T1-X7 TaxID=1194083 RepID=A0A077M224_9MICO|nr:hypothetical protein [Tetrasphaera japonica]CCH80403.1 hypothetical protein BN12_910010 [Tetrasphaera japonica T1-X7]